MRWLVFALVTSLAACEPRSISFQSPTPAATATPPIAAGSPSTPASPTAKPTLRPLPTPSPASRLLSYERGGDVGQPALRLLLLADGRVISEDVGGELFERRLTPSGAAALLLQAIQTGYFEKDATYPREPLPGSTPPAHGVTSIVFIVTNSAREIHVATIPTGQPDDNLYQPSAIRDKLSALARSYEDLSWVPASSWADSTPRGHEAAFHRVLVLPLRNVAAPPSTADVETAWPFTPGPEAFGGPVAGTAQPWRCAILGLEDARVMGDSLARARAITRYAPGLRTINATLAWKAASGALMIQMSPLLPHEEASCAGAQP